MHWDECFTLNSVFYFNNSSTSRYYYCYYYFYIIIIIFIFYKLKYKRRSPGMAPKVMGVVKKRIKS